MHAVSDSVVQTLQLMKSSENCSHSFRVIPRGKAMNKEQISALSDHLSQIESSHVSPLASMVALVRYVVERIDLSFRVPDQQDLAFRASVCHCSQESLHVVAFTLRLLKTKCRNRDFYDLLDFQSTGAP